MQYVNGLKIMALRSYPSRGSVNNGNRLGKRLIIYFRNGDLVPPRDEQTPVIALGARMDVVENRLWSRRTADNGDVNGGVF